MALSEAEIAKCAKWCTAPARKWQVLNRGKWKYQFHEKTLVRFVEEVKMDEELCPLLLEYLASDDCRSTLQLYGQTVDPAWTPVRAWYEISNKSVGSVHAIRLYHALALEPEAIGDGPYLVEDGCAYKVSLTYYWRQESVPQVPASESGISYRIINLSRDTENGLYSYAIEKRERVQQDIPEYVTGVTTTHETREEVHHGVRGELDAGGKQASVGGGKIVRRKVTKNADCTHDVHNETVKEIASPKHSESVSVGLTGTVKTTTDLNMSEPLPTDGLDIGQHVENTKTEGGLWRRVFRKLVPNALIKIAASCHKTLFSHSHSDTTVQSNDPGFTHVEEAGGGVVHDKRVSRTADGAYQITDSTTTEKPVQKSHEAVHVGLSGKTRSVTHRNQSSPAPEPTDIGESVENSRTEGGLWNVTIRTLVKNALIKIGDACSKTVFQHSHSNTKVQSSDPGESNVSSASGGVIHERRVSRTADGAFQINDSTTTELPVGDASESTSIGLEGTVKTTQRRNQPNKAPDPTDIGESVENTKTPGGLWNHTIRKRVLKSLVKLGEACRKSIFEHRHSKTTVQSDDPGFDHVAEAANGIIRDKRVSRTATGAFRVDESETTEKPVRDAVVTKRMTLNGLSVQRTHRNQPTPLPDPTKVGKSVSNRKTDGGRYDVTDTEEGAIPAGETGESCLRDAFTHHHAVTKNEKEPQDVETMFEKGKIVRKTATLTGNGTANNSTDTTTAVPKINKYTYTRDDDAIVHVIKYRNQQDIPGYPDGAVGLQINDSLNAFELHDGVISYLTNAPYKVTFGDLKFIKHGASQKFYEIVYSRRTRRFKHRVWTVQIHHIKGDAYTDYVSDWQRADIGRTTSGVMCTQLISRYRDKDGNELAEWKWVELTQPPGAWVICTQSCNHQWKEFSQEDFRKAAKALLAGGGDTSADNDKFHKDLIATLKDMPIATAAAMQGVTPETMKDEIARLDEARRAAAAQEAADAAARKDAEGGGK